MHIVSSMHGVSESNYLLGVICSQAHGHGHVHANRSRHGHSVPLSNCLNELSHQHRDTDKDAHLHELFSHLPHGLVCVLHVQALLAHDPFKCLNSIVRTPYPYPLLPSDPSCNMLSQKMLCTMQHPPSHVDFQQIAFYCHTRQIGLWRCRLLRRTAHCTFLPYGTSRRVLYGARHGEQMDVSTLGTRRDRKVYYKTTTKRGKR